MFNGLINNKQLDFIEYLLSFYRRGEKKLPSIADIADDLGISIPNVREQLAIAKHMGLITIQPRKGIAILPYDFSHAVSTSLYFAARSNYKYFKQYSDLRNQIEKAYFEKAASRLAKADLDDIFTIVDKAISRLNGNPIRIPHQEHKLFHLTIYKNLDNVFIDGLLDAYWNMYEMVGLNTYADIDYLQIVWKYHQDIAIAIADGEIHLAYQLLEDHIELLKEREQNQRSNRDTNDKDK